VIKTELLAPGVLKIVAPEKLNANDFAEVAPEFDSIIKKEGKIRLLIDGSHVEGWANIAALEAHASFVKAHQQKVERVAVIARYEWQHWLAAAVNVFAHPEIRVFDKNESNKALMWINATSGVAKGAVTVRLAADAPLSA
jgi:hypothetical protein